MRYITNILVIVLALGLLINPLSLLAEEAVETASSTEIVSDSNAEVTMTVVALSASITTPSNNADIQTGVATTFTASASGGEPSYGYLWNFGDGTTGAGPDFTKTYTTAGARTVTVAVTDFARVQTTAQITINVISPTSPLTATIVSPANNARFEVGQTINFSSEATGGEPSYGFLWNFGDGTSGAGANFTKTYTTAGTRTVTVTATDLANTQANMTINLIITATPPDDDDDDDNDNDDTTPPSQPTIISSTINTGATSTTGALTITWTASTDPIVSGQTTSGLIGYSYLIDHNPTTAPDATIDTTTTSLTQTLANGTWWLHLVAKDKAKNISTPVTHYGPMGVATTVVTTDPLTISNIRVTDVTHNSAIIRWTTNQGSSSRVIYDTVSHPSITGQSAPNFGYAFSTVTTDENTNTKIVEHAVSVTGLLPSTAYYFRVLSQ